jgi:hypothetical protein
MDLAIDVKKTLVWKKKKGHISNLRHFLTVLIVIYFMGILQCGPENNETRHPVTWLPVKQETPEYHSVAFCSTKRKKTKIKGTGPREFKYLNKNNYLLIGINKNFHGF